MWTLQEACLILKLSETALKKRCRELNIVRFVLIINVNSHMCVS